MTNKEYSRKDFDITGKPLRVGRTTFWCIFLAICSVRYAADLYADDAVAVWLATNGAALALLYARVKDIGMHGANTLWGLLGFTFFWFGSFPTDYATASTARVKSFRKKAGVCWVVALLGTAVAILS